MTADPLPEAVEPGRLTATLRLARVLGDAMVQRVTVISAPGNHTFADHSDTVGI